MRAVMRPPSHDANRVSKTAPVTNSTISRPLLRAHSPISVTGVSAMTARLAQAWAIGPGPAGSRTATGTTSRARASVPRR